MISQRTVRVVFIVIIERRWSSWAGFRTVASSGGHDFLFGHNGSETSFLILLLPFKQQAGLNIAQTCDVGNIHVWLHGQLDNGYFLLRSLTFTDFFCPNRSLIISKLALVLDIYSSLSIIWDTLTVWCSMGLHQHPSRVSVKNN